MLIKKVMHYMLVASAAICIFLAVMLMINAVLNLFSKRILSIFLVLEILLGLFFVIFIIFSKIYLKIDYSSFPSESNVAIWRWYVVHFQILLFIVNVVFYKLSFNVGQPFYLIIFSHFYWVVDIGYILPLMSR